MFKAAETHLNGMIFPGLRNRIVKRFSFMRLGALMLAAALPCSAPARMRHSTATVDTLLLVRSLNDGENLMPQAPSQSKVQGKRRRKLKSSRNEPLASFRALAPPIAWTLRR
jgi:hypothetical protein